MSGLMCSYNAMNGVPTCADHNLMTTEVRDTWGFDGYITGDCGAAGDVWDPHHYGKTPAESAADTIKAGMDVRDPPFRMQRRGVWSLHCDMSPFAAQVEDQWPHYTCPARVGTRECCLLHPQLNAHNVFSHVRRHLSFEDESRSAAPFAHMTHMSIAQLHTRAPLSPLNSAPQVGQF